MRARTLIPALAIAAVGAVGAAADDPITVEAPRPPEIAATEIYGESLMSPEQLAAYRAKLAGDMTPSEREEFLQRHREDMDARARSLGVILQGTASDSPGEDARPMPSGAQHGEALHASDLARGGDIAPGSASADMEADAGGDPSSALASDEMRPPAHDDIYGRELMTAQELEDYRERMVGTTDAERDRLVREHRERMSARARERDAQRPAVGSGPSEGHSPPQ
jgi:hypothetical protein